MDRNEHRKKQNQAEINNSQSQSQAQTQSAKNVTFASSSTIDEMLHVQAETTPETPLKFQFIRPTPDLFLSKEFQEKYELKIRPGQVTVEVADFIVPPFMSNWVPGVQVDVEYDVDECRGNDHDDEEKHINKLEDTVQNSSSSEVEKIDIHYLIECCRPQLPLTSLPKLSKDRRSYSWCSITDDDDGNLLKRITSVSSIIHAIERSLVDEKLNLAICMFILLTQCCSEISSKESMANIIVNMIAPVVFKKFHCDSRDLDKGLIKVRLIQLAKVLVIECKMKNIALARTYLEGQNDKDMNSPLMDELLCCIGDMFS